MAGFKLKIRADAEEILPPLERRKIVFPGEKNRVVFDTRGLLEGYDEPANILFVAVDGHIEVWIVEYDTWRDDKWTVQRVLDSDSRRDVDVGVDMDNDCDTRTPVVARLRHAQMIQYWIDGLLRGFQHAEETLRG